MKQIIVMIAMILLGIAITGYIGNFNKSASELSGQTVEMIRDITTAGAL